MLAVKLLYWERQEHLVGIWPQISTNAAQFHPNDSAQKTS